MLKWVLGFLNVIGLLLIVLFVSIYIPTFSLAYYERHYNDSGMAEHIQISEEELMIVTERLLDFMRGRYDNLYITATIAGEERQFFNQREIYHMEDVRDLFLAGYTIRNVAIAMFSLSLAYLIFFNRDALEVFAKCYVFGISFFLLSILGLVLLILTDFETYFIIFHEILFSNDLWILNPATDLLINLVPLQFFIDIFTFVSISFLLSVTAILIASIGFIFFQKKKVLRRS